MILLEVEAVCLQSEYYESDGSVLKLFKRVAHLRKTKDVLISGKTYISKAANHSFTLCRFLLHDNITDGHVSGPLA